MAWALWQLYHNSEALHAVFSPLVDAVYARFEATLAALDAFLDFFTNWFYTLFRPLALICTALSRPLQAIGFRAFQPLLAAATNLGRPLLGLAHKLGAGPLAKLSGLAAELSRPLLALAHRLLPLLTKLAGVLATPFRALWELCWALLPKRANLERNFVQGNITKIAKGVSQIKTQAGSSMGGQWGDSDDGLGPPPSQDEWWTDRGKAE